MWRVDARRDRAVVGAVGVMGVVVDDGDGTGVGAWLVLAVLGLQLAFLLDVVAQVVR